MWQDHYQTVPKEMSKYFLFKVYYVRLTKFPRFWLKCIVFKESIKKLSKLALWPSNNIWSSIADFLWALKNLPVKSVIPRCLDFFTKNDFTFDHNNLCYRNYT